MSTFQNTIDDFFLSNSNDNGVQTSMRSNFQNMYYFIDNQIPATTPYMAEKSVAKRKLLESLDAALRALK